MRILFKVTTQLKKKKKSSGLFFWWFWKGKVECLHQFSMIQFMQLMFPEHQFWANTMLDVEASKTSSMWSYPSRGSVYPVKTSLAPDVPGAVLRAADFKWLQYGLYIQETLTEGIKELFQYKEPQGTSEVRNYVHGEEVLKDRWYLNRVWKDGWSLRDGD